MPYGKRVSVPTKHSNESIVTEMSTPTISSLVCFVPKHNSVVQRLVRGRLRDALKRDADEFEREAAKCVADCDGVVFEFNNRATKIKRRLSVLQQLAECSGVQAICFFCHGTRTGIQAGFDVTNIDILADAIVATGAWQVILYACSCAKGPNNGEHSFASALRTALAKRMEHVDVFAHQNKGHTTRNPNVILFTEYGGGFWVVPRDSGLWGKWKQRLRKGLRFRFWCLDADGLSSALHSGDDPT